MLLLLTMVAMVITVMMVSVCDGAEFKNKLNGAMVLFLTCRKINTS